MRDSCCGGEREEGVGCGEGRGGWGICSLSKIEFEDNVYFDTR